MYDEIGGATAVSVAVDEFYQRVFADPQLAGYFDGVDVHRLKGHQRAFITAALGGPPRYAGRSMAATHERLNIQPAHFDAVVGHLIGTLLELGVQASTVEAIGATGLPWPSAAPARISLPIGSAISRAMP